MLAQVSCHASGSLAYSNGPTATKPRTFGERPPLLGTYQVTTVRKNDKVIRSGQSACCIDYLKPPRNYLLTFSTGADNWSPTQECEAHGAAT